MCNRLAMALVLGAGLVPGDVFGQNVTVQQPSFRNFSVGTTVMVPDSGGAFLGGNRRGASSRVTTGPFRSNTNTGTEFGGGSMSVHAWIHDLKGMDEALLNTPTGGYGPQPQVKLGPEAEHAFSTLEDRFGKTPAFASVDDAPSTAAPVTPSRRPVLRGVASIPVVPPAPVLEAAEIHALKKNSQRTSTAGAAPRFVQTTGASGRSSPLAAAYRTRAQHLAAQGQSKLAERYRQLAEQAEATVSR